VNRFGALVEQLSRLANDGDRCTILVDFLRRAHDPDRGWALALLTGRHEFTGMSPAALRKMAQKRIDPVLFGLSHAYVRDICETVALAWPDCDCDEPGLRLETLIGELRQCPTPQLPDHCARWLDRLDAGGRWALLKLLTGGRLVRLPAQLVKQALATFGGQPMAAIEDSWHGLEPPFMELFSWLGGAAGPPETDNPAPFWSFRPIDTFDVPDQSVRAANTFSALWDFGGVRVQISTAGSAEPSGRRHIFLPDGDDLSARLPDLAADLDFCAALDGELVAISGNRVLGAVELRTRLAAKTATRKRQREIPVHFLARDLLAVQGRDMRSLPFDARYAALKNLVAEWGAPRVHLSPMIEFSTWDELSARREVTVQIGKAATGNTLGGLLTRKAGCLRGANTDEGWLFWPPEPKSVHAVLMYAQIVPGTRGTRFVSYTFGVWAPSDKGLELVPIGKFPPPGDATDLERIDRYVHDHTRDRFGPVREVVADARNGCVCEIRFDGLNRAKRRKAGLELLAPRISRLVSTVPPINAATLDQLKKMLPG
jgi:DNA ligase-1